MSIYVGIKRLSASAIIAGSVFILGCQATPDATVVPSPGVETDVSEFAADMPQLPQIVPLDEPLEAPSGVPEELETVWEVWALLTREHVGRADFDPDVFTEAAIRGMLTALNDPHTNYVRPAAFNIENEDLLGRFEGIGANVSLKPDGGLMVVAPLVGSPAEDAGIRPGDEIIEVDGEAIRGLSLLEAVSKIRGRKGSTVELLVLHIGDLDAVIIKVKRGVIPLQSVLVRSESGDRIAHIRITNFFTDTADKLSSAIHEAVDSGAEGVVLDVRDNPGGLLSSVVDMVSLFVDDGLVLYEVDGTGRRTNWQIRRNDDVIESIPVVILANEYSASASEILVGALQDHERAFFIGEKTYGKGSVNVLRELNNGGGLYLTFAHWYTPDGRLIQGLGLDPDIAVSDRDARTEEVLQLEKAFEVLEEQISARASNGLTS
ncbi:MAG: S41 family peptidase [Chloroflexi bacterium]|nr:S41 family peptidase [Chloroflexota bacterium]